MKNENGIEKSAILKGRTLVNLAPKYEENNKLFFSSDGVDHTKEYNADYYKIIANGTNCNIALRLCRNNNNWNTVQPLKFDTKYLAIVDLDVQVSKNIHLNCGKVSYNDTYGKTIISGNGRQIVKLQFTTPTEIDNQINIGTDLYNNSGDYVSFYSIMIFEYQEGMENWDIPYFTGMQSVKMPSLTTIGKNLFDGELEYGGFSWSNGTKTDSKTVIRNVNPIKVNTSNICLTSTTGDISDIEYVFQYDENMRFNGYKTNSNGQITLDSNTCYINIRTQSDGGNGYVLQPLDDYKIQIEEGSTATSYEPYKSNILTVNESIELGGIGKVKDELDLLIGEVTKRIGEVVFDGSDDELWVYNENYDLFVYQSLTCQNDNYLSTNIIEKATWDGTKRFALKPSKYGFTSHKEGIEYLKNNPITIQYQLATESIKTVDLTVTDQNGNTESIIRPIEGTMRVSTSSQTLSPLLDMSVPVEATTQNLMSFANIVEEEK